MSATVRQIQANDYLEWLRMRLLLWPDCAPEVQDAEMNEIQGNASCAVFVAERDADKLCGFLEASIRMNAEGCATCPIGYIEGWFVDADVRRQGVGRQLILAAEAWAREKGCREMASDTELSNAISQAAHAALGYRESERLVLFRKLLGAPKSPIRLIVMPDRYAVCRCDPEDPFPVWATASNFYAITDTGEEISILCRQDLVPDGVRAERGWCCLRVAGKLDFSLVGVLASLLVPLAAAGVSVFTLSTFDTDYVLVREADLARAVEALIRAGHEVKIVDRQTPVTP